MDVAREVADEVRAGRLGADEATVSDRADHLVRATRRRLLQPVVNATGVLLHTNLGRAPLAHHQDAAPTNLEFDLATGERGSRSAGAASLLARACGAEAAMVVNNGAAAVLLVLAALARGRDVVVSRGELVEIGGGFRVPEVMEQSGARLVEVGTTNRTRRSDCERAAADRRPGPGAEGPPVQLPDRRVHRVARRRGPDAATGCRWSPTWAPGCSMPPAPGWPTARRPGSATNRRSARPSTPVPTWSPSPATSCWAVHRPASSPGDADLVARCARHPLARALRPGGLVLAALQDIALAYLRRDGAAIPFWRMATVPVEAVRRTAPRTSAAGPVLALDAVPGGGTLPGADDPLGRRGAWTATTAPRSATPTRRWSHGWRTAARWWTCARSTPPTTPTLGRALRALA